jgi:hypothetical protein
MDDPISSGGSIGVLGGLWKLIRRIGGEPRNVVHNDVTVTVVGGPPLDPPAAFVPSIVVKKSDRVVPRGVETGKRTNPLDFSPVLPTRRFHGIDDEGERRVQLARELYQSSSGGLRVSSPDPEADGERRH